MTLKWWDKERKRREKVRKGERKIGKERMIERTGQRKRANRE